jgi:molybdenum cofactor cytidylyltransferase
LQIAAIILAAGESRRMGREKALLPWPAKKSGTSQQQNEPTLLDATLTNAGAIAESVVVVAGHNFEVLSTALANFPQVKLVRNEDPRRGMFSSLQCGVLAAFAAGAEAAFVFHIDRPPVSLGTLKTLRQSLDDATNDAVAVVPRYLGTHGHPYAISRKLLREIIAAPLDSNARELMHATGRVEYVDCDDPAIVLDMNTPEEYSANLRGRN